MAERKGPERYPEGHDAAGQESLESGQQDDRSRVVDERDAVQSEDTAGEESDLIHNHRDSGPGRDDAEAGTAGPDPARHEEHASDADAIDDSHVGAPSDDRPDDHPDDRDDTVGSHAEVIAFRRRDDESAASRTERAAAEGLVDLDELGDEPVDLAALQSDDALLDVLGGTNPDVPRSGQNGPGLEALLMAWRRDVDAAPIGDLVDTDAAVAAIAEGRRPLRRLKRRHLVPVASAAAVLMITFTGVGLAARDALPGDMLWGVAQVLYTDHARAAQAASAARQDLRSAEGAWLQGDNSAAHEALKRAQEQMRSVDAEHGLPELEAAHASLEARFAETDGTPESSTSESSSSHQSPPSSTQPPPSGAPLPPPPPTSTTTPTPSTSQQPTSPTSPPSTTSDSSEHPSSGTSGESTNSGGLLPPHP